MGGCKWCLRPWKFTLEETGLAEWEMPATPAGTVGPGEDGSGMLPGPHYKTLHFTQLPSHKAFQATTEIYTPHPSYFLRASQCHSAASLSSTVLLRAPPVCLVGCHGTAALSGVELLRSTWGTNVMGLQVPEGGQSPSAPRDPGGRRWSGDYGRQWGASWRRCQILHPALPVWTV